MSAGCIPDSDEIWPGLTNREPAWQADERSGEHRARCGAAFCELTQLSTSAVLGQECLQLEPCTHGDFYFAHRVRVDDA